jgi:hypothetical protein
MKFSLLIFSEKSGRKKYEVPRLVCYGNVTQLTRGGSGHGISGGASGHSKHCRIAEVIYGVNAPRTQLIRAWLTERYERREPWSLVVVAALSRLWTAHRGFPAALPGFQECVPSAV